jgi:hypothetical protein
MDYILIFGNPGDGFEYVGPFKTAAAATEYAETDRELRNGGWWVMLLQKPADGG